MGSHGMNRTYKMTGTGVAVNLVAIKQLTGSSLPEEARECDAKSGLDCDWPAVPQTPTIDCHPLSEIVVWLRETNRHI